MPTVSVSIKCGSEIFTVEKIVLEHYFAVDWNAILRGWIYGSHNLIYRVSSMVEFASLYQMVRSVDASPRDTSAHMPIIGTIDIIYYMQKYRFVNLYPAAEEFRQKYNQIKDPAEIFRIIREINMRYDDIADFPAFWNQHAQHTLVTLFWHEFNDDDIAVIAANPRSAGALIVEWLISGKIDNVIKLIRCIYPGTVIDKCSCGMFTWKYDVVRCESVIDLMENQILVARYVIANYASDAGRAALIADIFLPKYMRTL
jgi:hypothetical protein